MTRSQPHERLGAQPQGGERFAIVVGPEELMTEENRDKGVGWETGFLEVDGYLPRTTDHIKGPSSQPSPRP